MRELAEVLLRGPNSVTYAEREIIAAFVSSRNGCRFCELSHTAAAAHHLNGSYELVEAVKRDVAAAPVTPKLKALLAIAAKVQQDGKRVTAEDIATARGAGATELEIHDAGCGCVLHVQPLRGRPRDGGSPRPAAYDQMGERMAREGYIGR